jgi:squalene-associated FAD-dependent desaturase
VSGTRWDTIVIGGGFAGLSAATALAAEGARVLVLEARPGLGGRATAFVDPATGEAVDNGQHVLVGCYRETFAFLRRIGAEQGVSLQPRLSLEMIDRRGRRTRLKCPTLPAPWHLVFGLLGWDALGLGDRLAALRIGPAIDGARRRLAAGAPVDDSAMAETVEAWLIARGQNERLREMLWEPLALAALNQPPREAAAATFIRVLAEMFGRDPKAAAIGLPAVPLDQLYAEPARQYLEAPGGCVRTNAPARVHVDADRVSRVTVRQESFEAPAVIAAVPWFAMTDLIPDPPSALGPLIDAATRLRASPIVTVNLWFDRPVLDVPFLGLPGRVMQWVFDKRFVFGEQASHLSLVSSGAAEIVAQSNEEIAAIAIAEIRGALPAAAAATLTRTKVVREKRATFSLAPGEPARPSTTTPVAGLLLAGDWIATGLPATIESAVVSGHAAAAFASGTRVADRAPVEVSRGSGRSPD